MIWSALATAFSASLTSLLSQSSQSGRRNGLTPLPGGIHCAATNAPDNPYVNEQDQIDIDNFLDTLAQVALDIAIRRLAAPQLQDEE